jgi:hypothetical protein
VSALVVFGIAASVASTRASGQETPAPAPGAAADTTKPLRVFIDCGYCDLDFMRQEMPWVDYMRDRADAQVHVLVTNENTGGGGTAFVLNFIGLKEFSTRNDTLRYNASSQDSQDVIRRGLTRMIEIGMMPFIAGTPAASRVRISLAPPAGGAAGGSAAKKHDPWNFWTFRVGFNGNANGESQSKSANYSGSFDASRTTEAWKLSFGGSKSESDQTFTLPDDNGVNHDQKFVSKSASVSGQAVKSLGANFSAGMNASISTNTRSNTRRSISLQPGVEYDFFPYKESNRRMLTAMYSIGVRSFLYRDTTIYFKVKETHPAHTLSLNYNTQEPWGSVYASTSYSQYLHDRSLYNADVFASTSVRLFKGFSFNVSGDYSRVHDQLGLLKGDASVEDILLRQRELRTDYNYFLSAGISYRFGSIFNNVVNPRFGGGGMTIFF